MAYSDDVLKAKASPPPKTAKPRTREDERARRTGMQSKPNGGKRRSEMSVTMVSAMNAAEQEAAELEAMKKRERLLIRAMIGGFLLLVLGLARQHNPDDHSFDQQEPGGDGSLRGSPSLEWQGDRPNIAQHLTLASENPAEQVHTKSILESPEDKKYEKYLDLVDYGNTSSAASGNSQDADAETSGEVDETTAEAVSTDNEDSTIESQEEIEETASEEEEYPVDPLESRLEAAEGDGN
ncbi:MAG: hypothetical protein SGBAC_011847 [Bacillariaceae sp.]